MDNRSIYKALGIIAALLLLLAPLTGAAQTFSVNMPNPPTPPAVQIPQPDSLGKNFWQPNFSAPIFHSRVCSRDDGNSQTASCDAHVVTDSRGNAKNFVAPSGYGPGQLRAAYNLSGTTTAKTILAVVDAYDDPNIASDLKTYDAQFGLPNLGNCAVSTATAASPCMQRVDETGGTRYPFANSGWDIEISLDVETAHSLCQNCSLLLVEARSTSYNDLLTAVDRAITMGAKVVSDSWGGGEFSSESSYDSYLNKPGVAITFSSGDSGYGVEYPASSKYVTAVGGTTLTMNGLTYGSEAAWSGAGSGCSAYEAKPAWQTDTGCSKRTVADVSADADPASGVAVYDSIRYDGVSGWFQVGGTSLASPIVAATYALSGNTTGSANSLPYSGTANLHDVTSGSNGSCSIKYLCTAGIGYDGPTGLGSPNGTGAF